MTADPGTEPTFDLDHYLSLPRVAGLALSPDGARLVTSVATPGRGGSPLGPGRGQRRLPARRVAAVHLDPRRPRGRRRRQAGQGGGPAVAAAARGRGGPP